MSAHNIEVQGGSTVRLPTAGKYCDRDIVVTATGGASGENKLAQVIDQSVTEITASDLQGATKIGYYKFNSCSSLVSAEIPVGVTSISTQAFGSCSKLTNVSLPEGLTTIGGNAFERCKFSIIAIPSTVTSISSWAFGYCSKLETVTIRATTPPTVYTNTFSNSTALSKIIVPDGCGDAYKAATNWSAYADIIVEESAV